MMLYYPARDGYPSMFDTLDGTRAPESRSPRQSVDFAESRAPNRRAPNVISARSKSRIGSTRPSQHCFADDVERA
jgi:hypothetical protein